jgi:hypothetical protein
VWESDSSGIVSDDVWDFIGTNSFLGNFTKFKVGLSALDADESKSSFFIVQESVVFTSFDHIQYIHDANWEFMVSSDLVINLKACLFILSDDCDLFTVSGQS